jgi:hypothetical protein
VSQPTDLVALVADSHQERVLRVLLCERRAALGLRPVSFDPPYVHPTHDPGVYREAHRFLMPFRDSHQHALVILDTEFPGSPRSRATIETTIQQALDRAGWQGRSQVIAIEPELEAWVWSDSPHVEHILGLTHEEIRRFADERGWWPQGAGKPYRPKELLGIILRKANKSPSAAVFGQLAARVGLQRCSDPAFAKLRETLRAWFAAT